METLYTLLGVSAAAEDAEILNAYRRLALRHHPDVSAEPKDVATRRFIVIQEAYEVLSDHQKRYIYDESIRARATEAQTRPYEAASLLTTLTPVRSSNIRAVGYDRIGGILEVAFLKGGVYRYYGVPEATYRALLSASSKGRFLQQSVIGRFPYRRISP